MGVDLGRKVKVGAVIRLRTCKGVAFAQVSHKNDQFGHLLRIFDGFDDLEPWWSTEHQKTVQFSAFFPLQAAVNLELVEFVCTASVPERLAVFPMFRARAGGPGGSVWLWDGAVESRLGRALTADEQKYPVRSIVSAPVLIDRVETGYRSEIDERW